VETGQTQVFAVRGDMSPSFFVGRRTLIKLLENTAIFEALANAGGRRENPAH
jgi:hypothetical protein